MTDEQEMSWEEAEAYGQNMVNWLRAMEKAHAVCVRARLGHEEVDKFQAEVDRHKQKAVEAHQRVLDAQTKADVAEADAKARIADVQARADMAKAQANEAIGAYQDKLNTVQQSLAEAQRNHKASMAQMDREAAAKFAKFEADHKALVAQYRDEAERAKSERDQAFAALREVVKSVPVG